MHECGDDWRVGVQHSRPHQHCLSSLVGLHAVSALVQHHPHSIHSVPGNRASTPSGSLRKAQRRSISLRARQTFAHTGDEGELLTKVIREGWLPQMHVEEDLCHCCVSCSILLLGT